MIIRANPDAASPPSPDPRPGYYYVSCTRGDGCYAIACGPYDTHQAALDDVNRVKTAADKIDPRSCWYGWGTCRSPEPLAVKPPIARKS